MDERDLHIRYSDSPSGVLRYAAARGQPVAEVASLLVEQYDADPRGMQARAAAASARVSAALESPETRRLRVEQLEAPVDLAANGRSVDGEKTGRLYYSAILAAAPCLSLASAKNAVPSVVPSAPRGPSRRPPRRPPGRCAPLRVVA